MSTTIDRMESTDDMAAQLGLGGDRSCVSDVDFSLQADFEFPDGDRYPIYLSEAPGGVRLSDRGDTLTRISYDHDIDAFLAGSRGQLIERILSEEEVGQDRGVFHLDAH